MTAPSIVRIAKPEDKTELWRLFLQGHRENGIFTLAPDKVEWFMNRCLYADRLPPGDTGTRGAIGVIGVLGALEAAVFVTLSSFWYTHDKHIEEFIVYTDPDCRKSRHAHALLEWMKQQVEATQLPLISGIMSNERTEAKCALYRRKFQKLGEFFYVGPKGSTAPFSLVSASS